MHLSRPFSKPSVRSLFVAILCAMLALVAHAAETSVRASLNRRVSVIGDPVTLQIKVTNVRNMGDPPDIAVDGLEISYGGTSTSATTRFDNGVFTSEKSMILLYQVVPQRNGSFTIPSVTVQADGKPYRTEAVGLTVQPSSAADGEEGAEKLAFAEFSIPKKNLFLGESIPIELRLYVDSKVRWQPQAMPEITGDGFAKQKIPEPHAEQVVKNGKDYDLLTFKTAITPIRAGKVSIGPSEVQITARIPRARRNRGPFDPFGDIFSDPFFSANQEMKVKADAVELTVKPLPQAGKPADFSGAVGNFHFSAEGSPKQVKVGDPVTMKLRISGKGSFDRVTAPVLADSTGWRSYPPSTTFQADDTVNYSGTKTFEMAVIPEKKKTAMPEFHFNYFDPVAEKYVTLKSEPAPLAVEGDTLPQPKPVATTTDNSSTEPKKSAAEPKPDDIIGLRYDLDETQSFTPFYLKREFWLAQGAVGLVFLGFLVFKLRRPPNAAVLQRAALQQEKEAIWRRLRASDVGHVDFFDSAARLAQIQTALATGSPVGSVDAATVRSTARLDASVAETIDEIFSARAEMHYAGGGTGAGAGSVSPAEHERVLNALAQLEKCHEKN